MINNIFIIYKHGLLPQNGTLIERDNRRKFVSKHFQSFTRTRKHDKYRALNRLVIRKVIR